MTARATVAGSRGPRPFAVLRLTMVRQRRALVWWSVSVALLALLFALFYPSVRDSGAVFDEYIEQLPEAFRAIIGDDPTSPEGYLWSQFFSSIGPIVLLVYTIGGGARAIAGEEEAGSLDLVLTTPVPRVTFLRDKALGLVGGTIAISVASFVALSVLGPPFDLRAPAANLAIAHALQALLALAFGAIALAIGAATGRRSLAVGVTSALAILSYLAWAMASSVEALEPLLPLSPFRWFADPQPVSRGTEAPNVVILTAIAFVAYGLGRAAFRRRDLGT